MILTTEQLHTLEVTRYEFHLRAEVDAVLPPFLGSTLRGAFGHALKAIACSMGHADCSRCFLVERCLYPRLFETSAGNGKVLRAKGTSIDAPLMHRRLPEDREALAGREKGPEGFGATTSQPSVLATSQQASVLAPSQQPSILRQPSALLKNRQDAPRPFIFSPPVPATNSGFLRGRDDLLRWRVAVGAGDRITFGLSLIGDAVDELPYIIYAMSLMAQHGFGSERAPFALERVFALDAQGKQRAIYTAGDSQVRESADCHTTLARLVEVRLAQLAIERSSSRVVAAAGAEVAAVAGAKMLGDVPLSPITTLDHRSRPAAHSTAQPITKPLLVHSRPAVTETSRDSQCLDRLTLRFTTPTRMRIKGQVMENPTFSQLAGSISLRLSMLAETYGKPLTYDYRAMLERAAEVKTTNSTLRLMALDRFSNRRGGKLELDGFMGDITFAGAAIQDLHSLLVAGEFLNVGSGTAFGLGRYSILS